MAMNRPGGWGETGVEADLSAATERVRSPRRRAWRWALLIGLGLWGVVFGAMVTFLWPPVELDTGKTIMVGGFLIAFSLFATAPVIAFGLYGHSAWSRSPWKRLAGYRAFAARFDGHVHTKPDLPFGGEEVGSVVFMHGGEPCVIDPEVVRRGKYTDEFTRLVFRLPEPTDFHCWMTPTGLLSFVTALHHGEGTPLGWDAFDKEYVVRANDEGRLREVFDRRAQELMLEMKRFAREHQPPRTGGGSAELRIEGRTLQFRMRGFLFHEEVLAAYYGLGARLFDHLAPRIVR